MNCKTIFIFHLDLEDSGGITHCFLGTIMKTLDFVQPCACSVHTVLLWNDLAISMTIGIPSAMFDIQFFNSVINIWWDGTRIVITFANKLLEWNTRIKKQNNRKKSPNLRPTGTINRFYSVSWTCGPACLYTEKTFGCSNVAFPTVNICIK